MGGPIMKARLLVGCLAFVLAYVVAISSSRPWNIQW